MTKPITKNTLFYGDNLPILREHIPDESVDLIYLDPPFNSNRSYNVLFKDESGKDAEAQITAFADTWHWGQETENTFRELSQDGPANVSRMIGAVREFIGENQMMAYLVMMTARLIELHRVLKPTGSIYLHCDPTASHYLKVVMDAIFGAQNFRNEIIWKRNFTKKGSQHKMTRFANNADLLLFYTKSENAVFKTPKIKRSDDEVESKYGLVDEKGRKFKSEPLELPRMMARQNLIFEFMGYTPQWGWMMSREKLEELHRQGKVYFTSGGKPRRKNFLDDYEGTEVDNIWTDISPIGQNQSEGLGYPTQKPLELLERVVQASSNPGDVVLDPFCGCGTAIAAAQKLNRIWIGIDITHLSTSLMKYRLRDSFGLIHKKDYAVVGEPESIGGARQLASEDRYQFQWWALSLVQAKPLGGEGGSKEGKKGSDKGIDGVINFINEKKELERVLIQVKSGHVKSGDIRDLRGTVEREGAAIGVFITLEDPSRDMITEAASAGHYHSKLWQQNYPRVQIMTIRDLLAERPINMPRSAPGQTFKQAEKIKKQEGTQDELF